MCGILVILILLMEALVILDVPVNIGTPMMRNQVEAGGAGLLLLERLPAMHEAAARWGATGFRAPATHRGWELMPLLGFEQQSLQPCLG